MQSRDRVRVCGEGIMTSDLTWTVVVDMIEKYSPKEILLTPSTFDYLTLRVHPNFLSFDQVWGPTITIQKVLVRIKDYKPKELSGTLDLTGDNIVFIEE
jgi:hypothetical protein